MRYSVIRPYDPVSPFRTPHPDWFLAFSLVLLVAVVANCMILFNMEHKPARHVPTAQERTARTMLELYGSDWYSQGCGQRRCK